MRSEENGAVTVTIKSQVPLVESHKETCQHYKGNFHLPCTCMLVASKSEIKPSVQLHEDHPPQTLMAGGRAASTKGPAFHLIPTVALVKLAERFELGQERKGDKAWNATSKNQECLLDREWLIERCSHIIYHAIKLRDQLAGLEADESPTDNAAAIAWGGVFLICATDALAKESKCNT